jgi:hypothetical protein
MGNLLLRLFQMSVRFVWFMLGVLPGHLLILMHSRALAARGRPQSALLPVEFYRVVGFVLTTVFLCGINGIFASSGGTV